MSKEKTTRRQVMVAITADTPVPPSAAANFFHFTVVGPEIQFLVGTVNLLKFHDAKEREDGPSIYPDISHRFMMSSFGFAQLKQQIDEIATRVPVLPDGMEFAKKEQK